MTPLKILLVSEWFPPDVKGGGELSAELLALNLAEAGHEVHVLTSKTDAQSYSPPRGALMHRTLQSTSPTSLTGNFSRLFVLPRQIRKEVQRLHAEHKFDVIHYLNVISILGSLPGIKKQFATINSHQPFCPKGNLFYKEREACSGCSPLKFLNCLSCSEYVGKMRLHPIVRLNPAALSFLYITYLRARRALRNVRPIAVSTFVSKQLETQGFPDTPIVPNFPPQPSIKKKKKKKHKKSDDIVHLLFLGALEKIKGVGLLLDAYVALPEQVRSRTKLQIVGSGPLRRELKRRAPKEVKFLGQLDSQTAQQLLAECDIVVLPSLWPEPFSRVLLEATSAGKPVVATDVGGNADVISDGAGGVLVPPRPEAFAHALEALIRRPELRKSLGESGRRRYLKVFSTKKTLAKVEQIYI